MRTCLWTWKKYQGKNWYFFQLTQQSELLYNKVSY